MRNSKFNNLFGCWPESESVLRGMNGFFLWLKRNTSDTIGITGGANRNRTFPSTEGKISCCGTMIGIAAIFHQVFYQAVMRIGL